MLAERLCNYRSPAFKRIGGFAEVSDFQRAHHQWISEALTRELPSETAIAVGNSVFVNNIISEPGLKAMHREVAW
jgi:hypothetical protein